MQKYAATSKRMLFLYLLLYRSIGELIDSREYEITHLFLLISDTFSAFAINLDVTICKLIQFIASLFSAKNFKLFRVLPNSNFFFICSQSSIHWMETISCLSKAEL